MRKRLQRQLLAGAFLAAAAGTAGAVTQITGAGSTFVYPVLSKWAEAYQRVAGVRLNYQSIGSGGGIRQIKAKTVDFGASDAPLKPDALEAAGLIQFPVVMGGVVPVVNLPGIAPGQLRLSPEVLAGLFLGEIRRWDDERIRALNPGLDLPDRKVTVVHRSDGSGTTWIFTNYLSKVSQAWARRVGTGKAVRWPAGVGGKGNEGVAAYVRRIKGAVGYVEYAYALQNHMTYAKLRNRAGRFVAPTAETFAAAAANADWAHAPGFYLVLTDQPGERSWPITGATFVLVHKVQERPEVGQAVLRFFDWAYRHGQDIAKELDYVPMPQSVVELVERTWAREVRGPDGQALWPPR
ncbi:MAG: phosphate ABC transporter substrate-binding protein PstS [Gammaproteobacteria bacterium]|nr:MAG: phosphate ABC transporter substrate-binding protein PstS [Gammaproteobacteria bacterium]